MSPSASGLLWSSNTPQHGCSTGGRMQRRCSAWRRQREAGDGGLELGRKAMFRISLAFCSFCAIILVSDGTGLWPGPSTEWESGQTCPIRSNVSAGSASAGSVGRCSRAGTDRRCGQNTRCVLSRQCSWSFGMTKDSSDRDRRPAVDDRSVRTHEVACSGLSVPSDATSSQEKREATGQPSVQLLKVIDAARALAICPRKLWSLTQSGEIKSIRIGRSVTDRKFDSA